MTISRLGVMLTVGALAAVTGCSLSRSALGTPPPDGTVSVFDGMVITPDAGRDAAQSDTGDDAWSDQDAYADDAWSADAFVTPDTNVDAATCTVGTRSCVGSEVWNCDADLMMRWRATCALGCVEGPAHCRELRATHVTDESLLPSGTTALTVTSGQSVQIDTATGAITLLPSTVIRAAGPTGSTGGIGFSTQMVTGGPELAIFTISTLQVMAGGTLSAVGPRALVLLASGNATIDGTIDVSGAGTVAGAGGFSGGGHRADGAGPSHGSRGDARGAFDGLQSGGGGGGHGGSGGRGGNEEVCCPTVSTGGAGGAVTTTDADGSILIGGSGGGGGADGSDGGVGGGGGGIVQITSRGMLRVTSSGIVRAVGAGGGPGDEAGGGGGAGGSIFLEALTIGVDGVVTVNGGAGGGGGGSGGGLGARGTDANTLSTPGGGTSGGGHGGEGAGGTQVDGAGGAEGDGGGGGGGGGGRISIVTMSGMRPMTGTVTPAPSVRQAMATIR